MHGLYLKENDPHLLRAFILCLVQYDSQQLFSLLQRFSFNSVPQLALLVRYTHTLASDRKEGAKLLAETGDERWSDELQTFMQRSLWPLLGPDRGYADRNRAFITLMLDVAIEREQRRAAAASVAIIPQVSRFDATWAT